jgi:hypothetical protein
MTVLSKRELEVDLFSPKLGSDGVPMLRRCALQLACASFASFAGMYQAVTWGY